MPQMAGLNASEYYLLDDLRVSDVAASVPLAFTAQSVCVDGKAAVTASVTNQGSAKAELELVTPYGSRTLGTLQVGAPLKRDFKAKDSGVAAGWAMIVGTASVDGKSTTFRHVAPYDAITCG
jgi:hypothetical protein